MAVNIQGALGGVGGFLQGFAQTTMMLKAQEAQMAQERQRTEAAKEQLKLLQARVKGEEAAQVLRQQELQLKLFEAVQKSQVMSQQLGAIGRLLGGQALAPGGPAVEGGAPSQPLQLPEVQVRAPGELPGYQEDVGRLRLLETERTRLERVLRSPDVLVASQSEEGSRLVSTLRQDYQRITSELDKIRSRYQMGTSDIEQVLRKPSGAAMPEEIAQARRQVREEKERLAAVSGERAGERQAAAQIRAAEILAEHKPLEGEAGERVARNDAMLQMTKDIMDIYQPKFTGLAMGGTYKWRQLIESATTEEETDFRRTLADVESLLINERTGAAVGEKKEYDRLIAMIPQPHLPDKVFQAQMKSFQRALRQRRGELLKTATTPRGQLRREAEAEAEAARAPAPTPSRKPLSEMSPAELIRERDLLRERLLKEGR
jgi:hypothetical protein